jgi:hypothetical protein
MEPRIGGCLRAPAEPGFVLQRETAPLTLTAHPAFDFRSLRTPDQNRIEWPGVRSGLSAALRRQREGYWLGAKMTILVLPAIMLGILLLGGVMLLFERSE